MLHRLKLISGPSNKTEMRSVEFKTFDRSQNDADLTAGHCYCILTETRRVLGFECDPQDTEIRGVS